jgi:hypothetical protein
MLREIVMNGVSPGERSVSEIRRDLRRRRSELQENLYILFRGRNPGPPRGAIEPMGFHVKSARMPAIAIAAGVAVAGFYLLRRRLWPLRFAGRFAELAAPVVVPILVRRIAGRGPGD